MHAVGVAPYGWANRWKQGALEQGLPAGSGEIESTHRYIIQKRLNWIQTCVFNFRGHGFPENEKTAYLELLRRIKDQAELLGVMLYTLARPSHQPEAGYLSSLPEHSMRTFAEEIRALGLNVKIST
ncbi:MAG: hypothetical protein ACU837_00915 [Gammaproteobacteria bacterium]